MKATIWKIRLDIMEVQTLSVPIGSVMLTTQLQNNMPVVWFMVPDVEAKKETRIIHAFFTGEDITIPPDRRVRYIGTVQKLGALSEKSSPLVIHYFEETELKK